MNSFLIIFSFASGSDWMFVHGDFYLELLRTLF